MDKPYEKLKEKVCEIISRPEGSCACGTGISLADLLRAIRKANPPEYDEETLLISWEGTLKWAREGETWDSVCCLDLSKPISEQDDSTLNALIELL